MAGSPREATPEGGRGADRSTPAWLVGVVALLLVTAACGWVLSQVDWDATVFIGFGEEAESTRAFAEDRLGTVYLRGDQGHDGKFFFIQANDPWVLAPETNAAVLDRPLYRSQRMFYPVLAGVGGALEPAAIVWGLLVVNLLSIGIGTWATAAIAKSMGMAAWWGLAFGFNVGLLSEVVIDGAGVVATAAAFVAVSLFLKGRSAWAISALVLTCLSREAMLIAALGSAWWLWRYQGERRLAIASIAVPTGAVVAWAGYLRLQIGLETGLGEVREIGLPFVGLFQAIPRWLDDPINLVVGAVILLIFVMFIRRVLASSHLVGWAFVGFAALGLVLTARVWENYFDMTRAVAPVLTAFVLMLFAPKTSELPMHEGSGLGL
jgi:hypothetical protein